MVFLAPGMSRPCPIVGVAPQAPKAPAVPLPNAFPETPFSTVRIFMAERGLPRAAPYPRHSTPYSIYSILFTLFYSILLWLNGGPRRAAPNPRLNTSKYIPYKGGGGKILGVLRAKTP